MSDRSSILQDLKLDFVYSHPLVYDTSLNIARPKNVYEMEKVYGNSALNSDARAGGGATPRSKEAHRGGSDTKVLSSTDESGGNLEAISRALLSQQEKLLAKVKQLHVEVDQLEKFLRKDNSAKADPPVKADVDPVLQRLPLAEQLKGLGDPAKIADIIAKEQQAILLRIQALHKNVDRLANDRIASDGPKISGSSFSLGKKEHCASYLPLDVVIHASPKNPPLSLLVILKGLQKLGAVKTATFVHSSVASVPEQLRHLIDGLATTYSRQDADFLITLIWKDVGVDPILWVNPTAQNPILAESNIVRFFLRLMNPEYDAPGNIAVCDANNRWLNAASKSLVNGGSKEKQSVVRNLNSHLGKASFLSGNEPGLLDAVILSALHQTGELKSPAGNVKKWFLACGQHELFEEVLLHL